MGPLGFYTICLKTDRLEDTVAFYQRLGFVPVGEDAPGLRVSLANGEDVLTFMTFLDGNIVNFRGAHIHRLMDEILAAGVAVSGYNEMPEQQPLMLDDGGQPLPHNECGHFTVNDPDGHELFFNTHPHERAPFEAALAGGVREGDQGDGSLGRLVYCLEVTDLNASLAFYQTLGLRALREGDGAWVTPGTQHRPVHFRLQLRESSEAGSRLRIYGGVWDVEGLRSLGFKRDALGWSGTDPDRRRLDFVPESILPHR